MNILSLIKSRRSIRDFTKEEIDKEIVDKILEGAKWAPSGLNNQPWRFSVVRESQKINKIASFTKFSDTVKKAPLLIVVFFDKDSSYDRTKDIQAIGACIQNMLLVAEEENIGTCWMGEIINRNEEVEQFLEVGNNLELMAVLCLGKKKEIGESSRKDMKELMV